MNSLDNSEKKILSELLAEIDDMSLQQILRQVFLGGMDLRNSICLNRPESKSTTSRVKMPLTLDEISSSNNRVEMSLEDAEKWGLIGK